MKHLTAIFFQGLVTILPLAVTVFVLFWLGMAAEGTLGVVIKWTLPQNWYVPGMGVVAGVGVIFLVGLLVNIWGVPQVIHLGELLIGRIPLVKTVYGAVRDLLGFFSTPGRSHGVSKVVIVTLTDTNIRVVGLLTREHFDDLPEGLGGTGYVVVYVPYSYQIGGFTILVPRERVQPIDMPLEDAMRFIVTAGAKRRTVDEAPDKNDSA
jgi:uncharacterized membrane protein